ncbi:MAG: NAD-dependent epimerase/dehydratase family protein [Myxococcota bacterium]|nr:NAD-dependent epimerase/dehydratase family protein [Myxococcota bacterium]
MSVALVTGSAGLVGSDAVRYFAQQGMDVVGIDNDMRAYFFGEASSTAWNRDLLSKEVASYTHHNIDIRDSEPLRTVFERYGSDISLILHTAAQPSHDWAAKEPMTDFSVNAVGTLNLLELTRKYCPKSVFIFVSTNKVYGDRPNTLPLLEHETRWEISQEHPYFRNGIDEEMSIDNSMHSLFGASKAAADLLVQEYGRYFDMKTACFRGGCLTGPQHSGAQLHGFLAYLVKCAIMGTPYTVFGYKGKQVRDNIHSRDLTRAFWSFYQEPRVAEIYNIGGGRFSNCSMLEAIRKCEVLTQKPFSYRLSEQNRMGDHIWWISDTSKFQSHYPDWQQKYDIDALLEEMVDVMTRRLRG